MDVVNELLNKYNIDVNIPADKQQAATKATDQIYIGK